MNCGITPLSYVSGLVLTHHELKTAILMENTRQVFNVVILGHTTNSLC
jgi:hypothetical protein